MAIVIWNPTDELLEAQYIGEFVEINPGQKIKVDDNRGKALLNTLGPRGLTSLEYGDEGEVEQRKGQKARERNFEFQKQQVIRYNQMNEDQKTKSLPYLVPTDRVKEYSKNTGIALLEPYSFKDKETTEIADLRRDKTDQKRYIRELEDTVQTQAGEITQLGSTLDRVLAKVEALEAKAAGAAEPTDEKKAVDLQAWRDQLGYRNINRLHLEGWVARNWDNIFAAPSEIQEEIRSKWATLLNKPFPESKPEVEAA